MSRRFQFSLRALFYLTTIAAVIGAAVAFVIRIWDSLDPLMAMVVAYGLPPVLGAAAILSVLPFAYYRSVRNIKDRRPTNMRRQSDA